MLDVHRDSLTLQQQHNRQYMLTHAGYFSDYLIHVGIRHGRPKRAAGHTIDHLGSDRYGGGSHATRVHQPSPDGRVHDAFPGGEVERLVGNGVRSWPVYLDLPDMGVPPVQVIGQNRNLEHKCMNECFSGISAR